MVYTALKPVKVPHPSRNLGLSSRIRVVTVVLLGRNGPKKGIVVMKCYIKSSPDRRGYRRRIMAIWSEEGICEITEQRLACQARAIKTNG